MVVVCGATELADVGDVKKAAAVKATALPGPHRLVGTALDGVKVVNICSGPASNHCVAITDKGACFVWGKNHRGQLGVGDEQLRNCPTPVAGALAKEVVVAAATGKAHTVFITAKGQVWAAGDNKFGCVGPAVKKKQETAPVAILVPGISGAVSVACGADFSMVTTSSGKLFAFGWSEFGQLGFGTDGSFNQSASSVKITYEAEREPRSVPGFGGKPVVQVACGPHHSCALTSDGTAFTWGCGNYCRLGHQELGQKDLWTPKPIPSFLFRTVSCGNAWTSGVGWQVHSSAAVKPSGAGMLFQWGRMNPTKDAAMYPKPEYELQGWDVRHMASGNSHCTLVAEGSTISWGTGCAYGELGYGPAGAKSSAKPKKMDLMEGVAVGAVACGMGHSLFLAEAGKSDEGAAALALPAFTPPEDRVAASAAQSKGGKRGAAAAAPKGKKAKK